MSRLEVRDLTVGYESGPVLHAVDVEVPHGEMIFKFDPGEAAVLAPYALPLAQEAYDAFVKRYGFTPKGPILIEVFPVHDDFAVRTLGLPGLVGALGACFGRVIAMDSPQARQPPGTFSWHATLWHEIAHVFTLQLSDYRVPRWLTEGVSGYEEHRRHPAWGRELTLEYAHALSRGGTFGVKKLPEGFKRPETSSIASRRDSASNRRGVILHNNRLSASIRTQSFLGKDDCRYVDDVTINRCKCFRLHGRAKGVDS